MGSLSDACLGGQRLLLYHGNSSPGPAPRQNLLPELSVIMCNVLTSVWFVCFGMII
jgi:hypothetical protein